MQEVIDQEMPLIDLRTVCIPLSSDKCLLISLGLLEKFEVLMIPFFSTSIDSTAVVDIALDYANRNGLTIFDLPQSSRWPYFGGEPI